ncbi:MAG TPA: hypothetical protein VHM24_03770 [Gemmatimonadaceae bacterium]|nr:hypothetical protein [Gemmatimonadaceae bacterium]
MTQDFEFVDEGRTFYCTVEAPRHAGMPPWWWFKLDNSESTRYAPFEALPTDTKRSVQKRIIAYYAEVLAIKARPVHQRPAWQKPVTVAAPGDAPAPTAVTTTR